METEAKKKTIINLRGGGNDYIRHKVNSKQFTCEQYFHRHNNVNTENEFNQNCDIITMEG